MLKQHAVSGFAAFALLLSGCSSSSSPFTSSSAGSGASAAGSGGTTVASAGATASGGTSAAAGASASAGLADGGGGAAAMAGASAGGTSGAASAGMSGGAGSSGSAGTASGGGSAGSGGATTDGFSLTSADFMNGGAIPKDATCATSNNTPAMPALAWTGAPAGTKSFAITFLDNTRLPNPQGDHYAIYDIPPDVMALPQGLPAGSPPAGIANLAGAKQKSPFAAAYLGPCPNNTNGMADTYAFTIYALRQDKLPGTLSDVASIVTAIKAANPLGQAVLTGTSDAKGTLR